MDILERYYNYIDNIADMKDWGREELVIYLIDEMKNNPQFKDYIALRQELLTEAERDKSALYYYLSSRIEEEEIIQMVIISIVKDIRTKSREIFSRKSFEEYHLQQKIFKLYPELFDSLRVKSNNKKDYELMKLNVVNFNPIPDSPKFRHVRYKSHFLFIDNYLDSRIPRFLIDKYGKDEIFIRIDPYTVSDTTPGISLEEIALRPPNPNWAKILRIYPGKNEGSEFYLPKADEIDALDIDQETKKKIWWESVEYKIRKLEITADMKNEGNQKHFSMSLEELSEENITEGKLIGRMIHLDAVDASDMPFNEIRLKHLDLAINVYTGDEKIKERMNCSLASGGVTADASYRTHLIRIDNVMLSDLLEIARLFFISETMVEEWIDTQFEFLKDK